MIDFIVVDDEVKIRKKMENHIDKYFISNNIEYRTKLFSGYNETLGEIINTKTPKIYFLDIEMREISGIDIAKRIRKVDSDSIIVFVTSHEEKTFEVLKSQVSALDFLIKKNVYAKTLNKIIGAAIESLYRDKRLVTKYAGITYVTYMKDIYCVLKDPLEKICYINTNKGTITTTKTLVELQRMTDGYLFKSHRSCLVNIPRIKTVNWQGSEIIFDNEKYVGLLARDKKKELKQYVDC